MTALNWIDWTVMVAYGAIVAALGFSFARGHKSTDEYFVGSRRRMLIGAVSVVSVLHSWNCS